jgi:dipeptidyl aminopeptidase/acylaminoacyl peptidase
MDGRGAPILADDDIRGYPQWSPDGTRLAYDRAEYRHQQEYGRQLVVWSSQSHGEEPITAPYKGQKVVYDWSPDGKLLLVSQKDSDTHNWEVWLLSVAALGGVRVGEIQLVEGALLVLRLGPLHMTKWREASRRYGTRRWSTSGENSRQRATDRLGRKCNSQIAKYGRKTAPYLGN